MSLRNNRLAAVAVGAAVLVGASSFGAVAGNLVTSDDIKNQTIRSVDIGKDAVGLERVEDRRAQLRLHGGERSFLYRGSITALAEQLAPHGFVRVHRSTVVNIERLTAIRSVTGGGLRLGLSSGAEVAVGRKFRQQVQALTSRRP